MQGSSQGSFDFGRGSFRGGPPAGGRKRPDRLFLAVPLDQQTSTRIGEFRARFVSETHLAGSSIDLKRLHISLHHVGDYAHLHDKTIYAAKRAAAAVAIPPFEVMLRLLTSFESRPSASRWPLVLSAEGEGLMELHRELGAALENNGLRTIDHFLPHMTLLYGQRPIATRAIEPILLVVSEFVLIHSHVGMTCYDILGRWSLTTVH